MTFVATLVLMDAVASALGAESHDGAAAAADDAERLLEMPTRRPRRWPTGWTTAPC